VNEPLLSPVTQKFTDRSTKRRFAFSYYCDLCGKEWRSAPQAFDSGGLHAAADLRVLHMLWNDQHKAAYERTNLEAIYSLSPCPECGRRVCMECLRRLEAEDAYICKDCLIKKGGEAGCS